MRNASQRAVAALQFGFVGLILLLALACGSASAPVTQEPRVSTGNPGGRNHARTPEGLS